MPLDYQPGERLGDYEILSVLGAGGMGKVYKVRNVLSDRVEAMKVLLPNLSDQKDRADRFLREIKLLARLSHPNIAELRTALMLDNQLVMIMEFVEGVTVSARLQRGALSAAEACNFTDQVLSALSYAHHQNIIHRDIKPANMMLTPQSVVKLMDFGLARSTEERGLTMTGTTMGSAYYMSPEQVRGETVDARSDIYSLGASLYEMTSGRPPFQGDTSYSLMSAHLNDPPKPPIELRPDVPAALNQIILMALAKDPAQRFQSADAFLAALRTVSLPAAASAPAAQVADAPTMGSVSSEPTSLFGGSAPAFASAVSETPASPSPAAAPAFQPAAAPPVVAHSGHRGVYIAIGVVIALIVLGAASFYVPRMLQTQAGEQASPTSAPAEQSAPAPGAPATANPSSNPAANPAAATNGATAAPATSTGGNVAPPASPSSAATSSRAPSNPPAAPGAPAAAPAETQPATPAAEAHRSRARSAHHAAGAPSPGSSAQGTQAQSAPASAASAASSGQAANAAQLEKEQQQMDQLGARAASVNDSLENLRRQQAAQGLGLRGDISNSQQLMQTYLSHAQTALQNGDAKAAQKYLDMAETQVGKLEKFLGR